MRESAILHLECWASRDSVPSVGVSGGRLHSRFPACEVPLVRVCGHLFCVGLGL